MRDGGDNCSICHGRLEHNSRTFGGETLGGAPALVGPCCVRQLRTIVGCGLYVTHPYEALPRGGIGLASPEAGDFSPEAAADAVQKLQEYVATVDNLTSDYARKAGLPDKLLRWSFKDTPWKSADAAWFKANPTRAHRLRARFAGEFDQDDQTLLPEAGYEPIVIVRQVEPGCRIRRVFNVNTEIAIPDIEEVLHAIFDQLTSGGDLSVAAVAELAIKYCSAAESSQ